MESDTSDHGFARRKNDVASAQPAGGEVDESFEDETPPSAPETDAADIDTLGADDVESADAGSDDTDADIAEADLLDTQAIEIDGVTSTHRKRPAPPRRVEHPATTGAIPLERIEAPAAVDVYDYDIDRRSRQEELGYSDATPHRRRRTDPPFEEPRRTRERRRGRAGWIAATFIFFLLFGSAATLDWYLWNTAAQWEQRANQLTEANYDLGARLSAEQQTTMQLNSEMDLLTQQLATSNQTVTDLSAEKAGAVDQSAIHLQEIEALEDNLTTAGSIANALHRCIDEQQQLENYLRDSENYEPEDLQDFSASVNDLCTRAEQANERLQSSLNQ